MLPDLADYIEALFLGGGPLIYESNLSCGRRGIWSAFPRGTTIRNLVSAQIPAQYRDAIRGVVDQIPQATAGRLAMWTIIQRPSTRPMMHFDSQVADLDDAVNKSDRSGSNRRSFGRPRWQRCASLSEYGWMDGLAQVNLIVTDLARAKEFWALLGWQSMARHPKAALVSFPNGMNLVLHEPEFARLWDPAYSGPMAGSTVVDVNLPSRKAVDDAHARVVAAGYRSSVEPWDTFFGPRYAIVCDADGHRIGLKSPQDPSRAYPLDK